MAVGLKEVRPPAPAEPPSPSSLRSFPRPGHRPKWPVWAKVCVALGGVLVVLAGTTMTAAYGLTAQLERHVKRVDILSDVPGQKVSSFTSGPLNFLVLGSDNRAADPSVGADTTGARSDTIMLVHIDKTLTK